MSIPVAFISELATGHLPPMINSNTCVILQSLIIPIETQLSLFSKKLSFKKKREKCSLSDEIDVACSSYHLLKKPTFVDEVFIPLLRKHQTGETLISSGISPWHQISLT